MGESEDVSEVRGCEASRGDGHYILVPTLTVVVRTVMDGTQTGKKYRVHQYHQCGGCIHGFSHSTLRRRKRKDKSGID